jgi:hypothetical protein
MTRVAETNSGPAYNITIRTEVYAAFPDYYVPPFHYANPVSGRPIAP